MQDLNFDFLMIYVQICFLNLKVIFSFRENIVEASIQSNIFFLINILQQKILKIEINDHF